MESLTLSSSPCSYTIKMAQTIYTENESIEIRRVITNGSSIMISLPKSWLKQNGIKVRDKLEVRVTKNKITIFNKKQK